MPHTMPSAIYMTFPCQREKLINLLILTTFKVMGQLSKIYFVALDMLYKFPEFGKPDISRGT